MSWGKRRSGRRGGHEGEDRAREGEMGERGHGREIERWIEREREGGRKRENERDIRREKARLGVRVSEGSESRKRERERA